MTPARFRSIPSAVTLALAAGAATPGLHAASVYNSLGSPASDRVFTVNFGDAAYDDLRVTSGGVIRSVSFAARGGGFGFGDPFSEATFWLYLDDGDGVPEVNPGSGTDPLPPIEDTLLLTQAVEGRTYARGETTIVTLDVEGLGAMIPAGGGLLWAGVEFSNGFSISHPLFPAPSVGTTDARVWSFTNGFEDVPAVFDPSAQNAAALGFAIELVPAPGAAGVMFVGAAAGLRRRRR